MHAYHIPLPSNGHNVNKGVDSTIVMATMMTMIAMILLASKDAKHVSLGWLGTEAVLRGAM